MKVREFLIAGAALMATGIILGAFGAHQLKELIPEDSLTSFKTGVLYQLIHGVALLALGNVARHDERIDRIAGRLMYVGCILFSGSIYLLSPRFLLGIEGAASFLGPITPIGGSLMIIGWLLFLYRLIRD